MKSILLTASAALLLALDWAALHDILKGEPNQSAEYGFLAFSAIVFGALIFVRLRGRHTGANIH